MCVCVPRHLSNCFKCFDWCTWHSAHVRWLHHEHDTLPMAIAVIYVGFSRSMRQSHFYQRNKLYAQACCVPFNTNYALDFTIVMVMATTPIFNRPTTSDRFIVANRKRAENAPLKLWWNALTMLVYNLHMICIALSTVFECECLRSLRTMCSATKTNVSY